MPEYCSTTFRNIDGQCVDADCENSAKHDFYTDAGDYDPAIDFSAASWNDPSAYESE